jgi:hypothetical protein
MPTAARAEADGEVLVFRSKRYRSSWSESATGIAAAKTTAAATVDDVFVCSWFQINPAQTAIAVQTMVRT